MKVRFAPSPTGNLHIGGVRTALFNYLFAKKYNAKFILRIEDTDVARSTKQSADVILKSLDWLGISYDEGPYYQSDRLDIYKQYADQLIAQDKAYYCTCNIDKTNKQVGYKYPKTCAGQLNKPNEPYVIRFKNVTEGFTVYKDKVFGTIKTPNVENQDFIIMKSDGFPLYNFGAVVDDLTMGITLVIRGRDHMINTPQQILLYQALNASLPEFAHLPMMLNKSGQKLSKRDGAVGVQEFADAGYSKEGLLSYLARFGWGHKDKEIFSMDELIELFSFDGCGKSDGKFDIDKSLSINFKCIKNLPDDIYYLNMKPFLKDGDIKYLNLIKPRAKTFKEAADLMSIFFKDFDPPQLSNEDRFKVINLHNKLLNIDFTESNILNLMLDNKDFSKTLRLILTGQPNVPGYNQTIMFLYGRDKTLQLLSRVI